MQDLKSLGDTQEIKIGNREVALLMGALFVVLVVVFGLGVMVGKRIYEQPPGIVTAPATSEVIIASQPVTAPPTPEPAKTTAQPPATGESYTFIDELGKKKPETAVATPEQHKPQPPPTATPATPVQPAATGKPAEKPKPQPSATAQPETKPKPQPAAAGTQPTAPKPTPKPTTKPTTPTSVTSHPSAIPSDWKWSIQVAAVSNKENADRYVGELKKKGLDSWLFKVTPASGGNPLFVVRVGHYRSSEEAKKSLESYKASGLIPDESIIRVKQ